ncbi:MAG TPA: nuclear transport factor 2 family protein [Bacteroidia bacterium]|nr:nuclear transport factor 2 family protein [Bacteroidia bacterium]
MKKLLIIYCLFCGLSLVAQKHSNDENKVLENMKTQEESWNKGDVRGFMEYYWKSDSLKFIGSKGITYGWQKTLDNYIKGYPSKEAMGILTFTILEATQLSETNIYVIGKWELKKEKPSGGHFTLLWKKINSKWVIVADHTS